MNTEYADFLEHKRLIVPSCGIDVDPASLHSGLKPFQRDLVHWALRKGRAALFTATGTGKTFMQVEWARNIPGEVLILAPLSVVSQTKEEAVRWGISLDKITIVNYEQLHKVDVSRYEGVVLDESSILKDFASATRNQLIEAFADTPYRLACTATPAPNDIAEIANHAEFLGVMRRVEMLSSFFIHDEKGWRLKGHAREAFYRWLASWGMSLTKPSDLGYGDEGYDLPNLNIRAEIVPADYTPPGQMFAMGLHGVTERAQVRRGTLAQRVERSLAVIAAEPDEQWLIWCGLDAEQQAMAKALGSRCVSIDGKTPDTKKLAVRTERVSAWRRGDVPALVSKLAVFGWGMNFQHCARMLFVGLGDSYEGYYQGIRRCWRYGQQRPVDVVIVLSDLEETIYHNVLRKEREAEQMIRELVANVAVFERAEVGASGRDVLPYTPEKTMRLPKWLKESA